MLRAIIIDDEFNGLRALELLIKRSIPDVKLVALTSDPHEGVKLIETYRPDILFLDINMPSLNGFQVLENLQYDKFHIIFTTAHQEYAIKAIRRSATDYLLKPVDAEDLIMAVQRVKEAIDRDRSYPNIRDVLKGIVGHNNLRIPLPTKGSIEYVTPSLIVYIEANHNSCKVLLTNAMVLEVNKPLREYEALLCKENFYFMRVHNSFVVNLNYVTRYLKEDGGYIIVQDKKSVPVSKHKKEEFLSVFNLKNLD